MAAPLAAAAGTAAATAGRAAASAAARIAAGTAAKQGARAAAGAAARQGARAAGTRTAQGVFGSAMPTFARLIQNPNAAGRFLKSRAGKKAMFEFGIDLLNTKDAQRAADKIMSNIGNMFGGDKQYQETADKYRKNKAKTDDITDRVHGNNLTPEQVNELMLSMKQSIEEMREVLAVLERMQAIQMQNTTGQNTL